MRGEELAYSQAATQKNSTRGILIATKLETLKAELSWTKFLEFSLEFLKFFLNDLGLS